MGNEFQEALDNYKEFENNNLANNFLSLVNTQRQENKFKQIDDIVKEQHDDVEPILRRGLFLMFCSDIEQRIQHMIKLYSAKYYGNFYKKHLKVFSYETIFTKKLDDNAMNDQKMFKVQQYVRLKFGNSFGEFLLKQFEIDGIDVDKINDHIISFRTNRNEIAHNCSVVRLDTINDMYNRYVEVKKMLDKSIDIIQRSNYQFK